MKSQEPGVPDLEEWVAAHAAALGGPVGVDPTLVSLSYEAEWREKNLAPLELVPQNLVDLAWGVRRPRVKSRPVVPHPRELSGERGVERPRRRGARRAVWRRWCSTRSTRSAGSSTCAAPTSSATPSSSRTPSSPCAKGLRIDAALYLNALDAPTTAQRSRRTPRRSRRCAATSSSTDASSTARASTTASTTTTAAPS